MIPEFLAEHAAKTEMEKLAGWAGVEGKSFLLHWSMTGGMLNLRWTTVVERTRWRRTFESGV